MAFLRRGRPDGQQTDPAPATAPAVRLVTMDAAPFSPAITFKAKRARSDPANPRGFEPTGTYRLGTLHIVARPARHL